MRAHAIAVLMLALSFAGAFGAGYAAGSGDGAESVIEYRTKTDTLVQRAFRLDTVYIERVARYDSLVQVYDTVRVTDTVMVDGVVFVPRSVADEAIQACSAVVMTCEEQKANLTARLAIAESIIQKKPSKRVPYLWAAAGLVTGLLVR